MVNVRFGLSEVHSGFSALGDINFTVHNSLCQLQLTQRAYRGICGITVLVAFGKLADSTTVQAALGGYSVPAIR